TQVGSLSSSRADHTMTLLQNGQVLVAGGFGGNGKLPLATTELYRPASSSWISGAVMPLQLYSHTAVLLDDGKVLVVGGLNAAGDETNSANVYDLAGHWLSTSPMAYGGAASTATVL